MATDPAFAPGTHGCHEALHVASILTDMVGERLMEHPAISANPEWFRLAEEAQEKLYELYQAIGALHMPPAEAGG
jgi:hypothetical protein